MPITVEKAQRDLRQFARVCAEGNACLYATLAAHAAETPELAVLATRGQRGQTPSNLLFGAVHFLLLGGTSHALARFYPSLEADFQPKLAPEDAGECFADFCATHAAAITDQVTRRRIQTNAVGRCGVLMPALAHVFATFERPLQLFELGPSAGLNLLLDQYEYEYDDGRTAGPPSPVIVRTEIRGPAVFPVCIPPIADRVGVDIAPVDITDDDASRWTEALIWPDDVDRHIQYRAARECARAGGAHAPPRLIKGDGLSVIPKLIADMPADALPCVFHTHATYQMDDDWKTAFGRRLDEIGACRDLAHVSIEWHRGDAGPRLDVTMWRGGDRSTAHLADCHYHGRWIAPTAAWAGLTG